MTLDVCVQPLADYQPQAVGAALRRLLAPLGGMAAFVQPGQRVLIKPNLLMAKSAEAAVTTHPEIVRGVILLAQEAGGQVSVGDSPGFGRTLSVAETCGLAQVAAECGAEFVSFETAKRIAVGQGVFRHLEIARDLLEADVVLNLPKVKTHQMMGLTCGVKNLFGAIVGMRKAGIHLQAGTDKALFARMLLDLADRLAPSLTIADGVVAMEGNGPGSGTPVPFGLMLASTSPLALDTVVTDLSGLGEERVWTQKVARELGRSEVELDRIVLHGPSLTDLVPLTPAQTTDVDFGLPQWIQKPLRRSLVARPRIDHALCVRCGLCIRHCPPKVMQLNARVTIDDKGCIRCFCCQELCPKGAVDTRQGLLLRLSRFLAGRP